MACYLKLNEINVNDNDSIYLCIITTGTKQLKSTLNRLTARFKSKEKTPPLNSGPKIILIMSFLPLEFSLIEFWHYWLTSLFKFHECTHCYLKTSQNCITFYTNISIHIFMLLRPKPEYTSGYRVNNVVDQHMLICWLSASPGPNQARGATIGPF